MIEDKSLQQRGLLMCRPENRPGVALRATLRAVLLVAALAPAALAQMPGEDVIDRQYAIKAAYLFNFTHYVTWPADTFPDDQAPFVIGAIGDSPMDPYLDRIAARKKVDGRQIVIRRFRTPEDCQPCQILLVGRLTERQQQTVLQRVGEGPVLLVGDTPGFAQRGGIVNFFLASNKVRFEINRKAAEERNLKISAKLLALAKIVPEDKGAAAHLEGGQIAWHAEGQRREQQAED